MAYRNLADAGSVSADHEVSTLPAAFLQQPHLAQVWRTPAGTTTSAIVVDLGSAMTIRVVAVLGLNLTAAGTARVKLSIINGSGDAGVYDSALLDPAGVDPAYRALICILPQDYVARYVLVELADSALSYIEAGRLFVGPAWLPDYNYARDAERLTDDRSIAETALGGQEWVDSLPVRRGIRLRLPAVSEVERQAHYDAIGRYAGRRNQVLVALDPDSDNLGRESYFGRLQQAPTLRLIGHRLHELPLELMESL